MMSQDRSGGKFANLSVSSRPTKQQLPVTHGSSFLGPLSKLRASQKMSHFKAAAYWKARIAAASGSNPHEVWRTVNSVRGKKKTRATPAFSAKTYYNQKINDITDAASSAGEPAFADIGNDIQLNQFRPAILNDVVRTIEDSPSKQCVLAPLPTLLLLLLLLDRLIMRAMS